MGCAVAGEEDKLREADMSSQVALVRPLVLILSGCIVLKTGV